jgi:hypothetical protein
MNKFDRITKNILCCCGNCDFANFKEMFSLVCNLNGGIIRIKHTCNNWYNKKFDYYTNNCGVLKDEC